MTDDSPVGPVTARYAFAALIEADRSRILADYMRRLDALDSPVARDPVAREQSVAHASQTLTDVIGSVQTGRVQVDEDHKLLAWDIGETRAASAMPTGESWRATVAFFEAFLAAVIRHVDVDARDEFAVAMRTLNQSLNMRIREATGAYTSYLLNRIHRAQVEERRRVARELHDRVGNGLSVAHRQLELFPDYQVKEPTRAADRVERAHQAVVEAMESLRSVISDLRLEAPVKSLEKALASYLESVPAGNVSLRLRVNGDETWVPPTVRDESFLIIREAVRNALAHGDPAVIFINADIAPHELRATVEDTGRGFTKATSGGTGLSSMRERAALLGGTLMVSSQPNQGTQVELVVPLQGSRDEAAGGQELTARRRLRVIRWAGDPRS
jgi:signal transduction histidine kinase